MLEIDLEKLLRVAVLRLRAQLALRWALGALVGGLLCAAAALLLSRLSGADTLSPVLCALLPGVAGVCAGALAFWLGQRKLADAAALLDRRAKTQEQFSTWLYLRGVTPAVTGSLRQGFVQAQRASALRAADSVRLSEYLPLRLPRWSRAVWLALIVFISAVMTPAATRTLPSASAPAAANQAQSAAPGSLSELNAANFNTLPETARVQVLSPAQLRKLELIATDARLPPSAQADALKELQSALGNIPENELTSDVRELLHTLREASAATDAKLSSAQSVNSAPPETPPAPASAQSGAAYAAFQELEKGWSSREPRFSDVKEALRKYYEQR